MYQRFNEGRQISMDNPFENFTCWVISDNGYEIIWDRGFDKEGLHLTISALSFLTNYGHEYKEGLFGPLPLARSNKLGLLYTKNIKFKGAKDNRIRNRTVISFLFVFSQHLKRKSLNLKVLEDALNLFFVGVKDRDDLRHLNFDSLSSIIQEWCDSL